MKRVKLNDTELSDKIRRYEKQARIWWNIGVIGVLGGLLSAVVVQDRLLKAILVAVLFFGGICCALFLGGGARESLKRLMREQLGDFFQEELERSFGPNLHTPEMRIDQTLIQTLHLLEGEWEECVAENFYEGRCHGIHFSAANVRLYHVYMVGIVREGCQTRRDSVFQGIVLRLKTRIPADAEKPKFEEWMADLQKNLKGQILGYNWEEDVFSIAVKTEYLFASAGGEVDLSDLYAVRRSYTDSLRKMEKVLIEKGGEKR